MREINFTVRKSIFEFSRYGLQIAKLDLTTRYAYGLFNCPTLTRYTFDYTRNYFRSFDARSH